MHYYLEKLYRMLLIAFGFSVVGNAMAHSAVEIDAAPKQLLQATLSTNEIPDSAAMIIAGAKPAILVKYKGEQALRILADDGQQWLLFDNGRVLANRESAYWDRLTKTQRSVAYPENKSMDNSTGSDTEKKTAPEWWVVSDTPQLTWLDPRLSQTNGNSTWSIRTRIDEVEYRIKGQHHWKTLSQPKKSQAGHAH